MSTLEKTIAILNSGISSRSCGIVDTRAILVVTAVYILAVLSVPMLNPGMLVWLLCYPIVTAGAYAGGYWRVLRKSLWILPLVVLIGIFNPILDKEPMWMIAGYSVSRGWVTFISLTLRGMLTVQALLVVVSCCGFYGMCRAFDRLHVPHVLVTQLMLLYRFLTVMLEEALTMQRSRQSRGFGRRSYPLGMWGTFVGQLMLRSVRRARRVNNAMLAREFTGTFIYNVDQSRMRASDWLFVAVWIAVIAVLRFVDMSTLITIFIR